MCSCQHNPCEIFVKLSSSETLQFTETKKAYVQAVVDLDSGESYATKPTMFTVYPIYGNEGAGGIDIPIPGPSEDGYIILDAESIGGE